MAMALQLSAPPARAQAGEATPVQLSDAQVKQIVEAVTAAVLQQMKSGQAAPAASPAPEETRPSSSAEDGGFTALLEEKETFFIEHLETAIQAYPALFGTLGNIIERLDFRPRGTSPLGFLASVLAAIGGAAALALAAAMAARRLLPGGEPKAGSANVGQTLRRAGASLVGLAVFWLVSMAAARYFANAGTQTVVARWMFNAGAQFAFYYTLLLIWFRPAESAFRIVPLGPEDARAAMRLFAVVIGVSVLRSWITILIAQNQPVPVVSAGLLINNLMFVASFFAAAVPARAAIGRWIENAAMGTRPAPLRRWLGANWLGLAGAGVLLLSALHAYGAVAGHTGVVAGLTSTVRAVIVMILVCAAVEFVGRRADYTDQSARRAIPKLPGLVSKMLRVFILLGAAVYFIKLWGVDALGVMSAAQWSKLADDAFEPLAALFGGYLAISYVNYAAARYLATRPRTATTVNEDGDVITSGDGSSRLRTLVPILRVTSIVIIIVMIGLLVLSQLGFNITPLLAGASVIGLAISFGSQALVKDIVSGVLFLAEDSFRIGEYIGCGSSSGTVEGFTLRSVRLRHQDGQIFTVPFGQLGEITNYSRDWSTVKFNMSLDRDVDLDDVRRVTANVANELKSDFRERLLDPLKVQGVKDVTDNAIVVQFKFTSLPRDPSEIERMARSRLLKAFKDEGIALSRPTWFSATAGAVS